MIDLITKDSFIIVVIVAVALAFGVFSLNYLANLALISENIQVIDSQSVTQFYPEQYALPDLIPLTMYNIRFAKINGRTVIRFTSAFWNGGKQPFELVTDSAARTDGKDKSQNVYQKIIGKDGRENWKPVGNFLWHHSHNHHHYSDFADYIFTFIRPAPGTSAVIVPSVRQKTTFCLRDNDPTDLTLVGAPAKKIYTQCGLEKQGVSIGWTDVYKYDLPEQYVDVQDMPPGIYSLSFLVDPNQHFIEEHKDNNISTVFLDLNVAKKTIKVVGAAAPFETKFNKFPDDTLVRAEESKKIYLIKNNKKHQIKNENLFEAYGYKWDSVYSLTEAMVEAIPLNNLIRLKGSKEFFALNIFDYKRRIPNQKVLNSYQLKEDGAVEVNEMEFKAYADSNLVMLVGNSDVYSIEGVNKKKVGTIDSLGLLGYNLDSVHTINKIDFDSYNEQK